MTAKESLFFSMAANAQDSYTKTLKEYFEVSGSLNVFKTAVSEMITNMKVMNSTVPEEFWKEMEKEMLGTSIDDLISTLEPVYKKHLTESDLKDVIKFYKTPAGKKLAQESPSLTQESMQAGQRWGQSIAGKVLQKMKEKGY